jgi:hypothetical protein
MTELVVLRVDKFGSYAAGCLMPNSSVSGVVWANSLTRFTAIYRGVVQEVCIL